MTDEERKQFINEYCRNVAHKPITKLCNTCEYLKFCARSGIEEVGCDRYKRDTTTNEEWLRSATTEQLAKWIAEEKLCRGYFIFPSMDEAIQDATEWLKEIHE